MSGSLDSVSVGIVGLGRAGWHLHFQPIMNISGFKVVAVADPDLERCAEANEVCGCEQYENIEQLLEYSSAELIVVATPSMFHFEDACKVISAGRHCLLEKPIAMNLQEGLKIAALAEKHNVHVFVHHVYLHLSEYNHFCSVLERDILGPLFHISVCWGSYARRWDWQTLKKNGGGQLNNTCPHPLSIVLPLIGDEVSSVCADLRNIKDTGDAEDHVSLFIRAKNGVTAYVVVSSAQALTPPKWLIMGKNGALESDGKVSRLRYFDPKKLADLSVIDAAAPGRSYLSESIPWVEEVIEVEEPRVEPFHINVLNVIRGISKPIITMRGALEVLKVMDMAKADCESR